MERIQELINESGDNPVSRAFPNSRREQSEVPSADRNELLPCYFFDYMVGTSTGGYVVLDVPSGETFDLES